MIKLLYEGPCELLETKGGVKILALSDNTYAWVNLEGIGEVLVISYKPHDIDTILAQGRYKLYDVKNESDLSDQQHLELSASESTWQGYLLPTGLPEGKKVRNRIIPTKEVITPLKVA